MIPFRTEFPVSDDFIYLNSGTHSIAPKAVTSSIHKFHEEYEKNPTLGLIRSWQWLWEIQKNLAKFFEADHFDIFLRSNVTSVLNAMILGIPLPPDSEILYSDFEYGAIINICKFRAEKDFLKLREFEAPRNQENAIEKIVSALSPNTRILLISHVFTNTGLILPLEELAKETRKRGIFLVVDGAHAPGAVPLHFSKLNDVDFYAGNLHKWMMGPKGTAFGWVNKIHQSRLQPIQAGWTTYGFLPEHRAFGEGNRFQGRMALSACYDFAPFYGIQEMLNFWHTHGEKNILSRIYGLQDYLENKIRAETNWKQISPSLMYRGPLLAYELPDHLQNRVDKLMLELLHDKKLQIGLPFYEGKRCLRFSPHIYNTEKEIDRAVEIIKHI